MARDTVTSEKTKDGKRAVPLVEGLYKIPTTPGEKGHLIGRRCRDCGTYFYPNTGEQKVVCLKCLGRNLEEVALGSQGTLYSFTICYAKAEFVVVETPFAIGTILLPKENLLIWTTSTPECDLNALKVDMDVELVFRKVKEDEEGNDVIAFQFRPLVAAATPQGGD